MTTSAATSRQGSDYRRWLWWLLKWTLFGVVMFFVGRALLEHLRRVDWSTVSFRPLPVALAALCILGIFAVQMVGYRSLLAAFVTALPWRAVAAVTWVPLLGKYVPGKVAAIGTAVVLLRRWQVPGAAALSLLLILDGLAVLSGLIVGSPVLLMSGVASIVPAGPFLTLAVVVLGIVSLHPAVFDRLVNLATRLLRRPPLPRMPTLRDYAVPAACAFAQWALCGAALWFLASAAVPGLSITLLPSYISIAALAMTVSYLAVFTPGGLGVREGVFLVTLTPSLGATTAAVMVIAMRLLTMTAEIVLFAVGLVLLRLLQRGEVRHQALRAACEVSVPRLDG
jgi:uncharacterized membrane protein YbhN (UPF0104 family)